VRASKCGAVTFIQRFGDAMIDGVYAAGDDGRPRFHPLPAPEDEDVLRLTTRVAGRVRSLLERKGLSREASDPQQADPLSQDDPGMAALLASSVARRIAVGPNAGQGLTRTGDWIDPDSMDAFQSPLSRPMNGVS
jgi:hypothetical protein